MRILLTVWFELKCPVCAVGVETSIKYRTHNKATTVTKWLKEKKKGVTRTNILYSLTVIS